MTASISSLFMLHAGRGFASALFRVLCHLGPRQKERLLWDTCRFHNRGKKQEGKTKQWFFKCRTNLAWIIPTHHLLARASHVVRTAVTTEGTSDFMTHGPEQSIDSSSGEARECLGRGLPSITDTSRQLQSQYDKALQRVTVLILTS